MIRKHTLYFSHSGNYVNIMSADYVTRDSAKKTADSLYEDQLYLESQAWDNFSKQAPAWLTIMSTGDHTNGIKNPDYFFKVLFPGKKLVKSKDPLTRYEFYVK